MVSVEESRFVALDLFEDSTHEYFADETAAVGDMIPLAETVQSSLLAFVKQDRDSIFAKRFLRHIRNTKPILFRV